MRGRTAWREAGQVVALGANQLRQRLGTASRLGGRNNTRSGVVRLHGQYWLRVAALSQRLRRDV